MSGSDGSGVSSTAGIGGATTSGDGGLPRTSNCASLYFRATLNSPVPEVVATLKQDGELTVRAAGPEGPLQAVTADGEAAGSITVTGMAQVIACIAQGFEYVGIVKSVDGGICEIVVRPRSR